MFLIMARRRLQAKCDLRGRRSPNVLEPRVVKTSASDELQNKSTVVVAEPVLSPAMLIRHQAREANTRASLTNLQVA